MNKTLKDVLDKHFEHVVFDKKFASKVAEFLRLFLTKNDQYVNFFGSGLIGIHNVMWNNSDSDFWWDEVWHVDPEAFKQDLRRLPVINTNFKVASNEFHHAIIYTLHRVHHSPHLSDKEKEELKIRCMTSLNIKYLVSLQHHYFPYGADNGISEKTFNSLNNKFDLKVLGSWGAMLTKRSTEYIAKGARYYKTYVNYNFDKEIIVMITDAQGRIRETYKDITKIYHTLKDEKAKILSSSATLITDEGMVLKDLTRKTNQYIRYIQSTISTKDAFIKQELLNIVNESIPSLDNSYDVFEGLLYALLENYHVSKYQRAFDEMVSDLLIFSFDILKKNNIKDNDLPGLLYRLKHVYMSGRIQDKLLDNARKQFVKLVESYNKKLKNTPLIPERCGVFLYIVLRTIMMNKYK